MGRPMRWPDGKLKPLAQLSCNHQTSHSKVPNTCTDPAAIALDSNYQEGRQICREHRFQRYALLNLRSTHSWLPWKLYLKAPTRMGDSATTNMPHYIRWMFCTIHVPRNGSSQFRQASMAKARNVPLRKLPDAHLAWCLCRSSFLWDMACAYRTAFNVRRTNK